MYFSIIIKTAPEHPELFLNEANTYQHDCIARSPYIRSQREYINTNECNCLILEWMDNTLWETKDASIEAKARVFTTVAKSCLEALAIFQDIDEVGECVHGGRQTQMPLWHSLLLRSNNRSQSLDLNPNNILISGFSKSTTIVKVADLGWSESLMMLNFPGILTKQAMQAGSKGFSTGWIQGNAIRAPEIWKGESPNAACDIWSLGVSVS
jgi:serine/threonine protein kinase